MRLTLQEIKDTCRDWESFCEDTGYSVYSVKEGGGDVEVSMDIATAYEHGIVRSIPEWKYC